MVDGRDVPTGRFARFRQMARVGARTGLEMLAGRDGSAGAEQAAELLGNLRGLAAKAGQMASYVDGLVPPGQAEAYEKALSKLRQATPTSPFPKVKAILEEELGAPLAELFAEFEEAPMASASVGQVHRAKLSGGRAVAVKVQHPGIDHAVEGDLRSVRTFHNLVATFVPPGANADELFEEAVQVLRDELDYRIEAKNQAAFRERYLDDPRIHVPEVFESHSSKRVITSELASGMTFEEAQAQPEALRRTYAELLWHVSFSSVLRFGVFNADPHPGNYIFHADGRITFLDFGCVRDVSPGFRKHLPQMHRAAMSRDEAAFCAAAKLGLQTEAGLYEDRFLAYLFKCFEPVGTRPYRMERSYVAGLVRGLEDLRRLVFKRDANVTPLPEGIIFLNRLQFGFYSVLARLEVDADYHAVNERILQGID